MLSVFASCGLFVSLSLLRGPCEARLGAVKVYPIDMHFNQISRYDFGLSLYLRKLLKIGQLQVQSQVSRSGEMDLSSSITNSMLKTYTKTRLNIDRVILVIASHYHCEAAKCRIKPRAKLKRKI